MSNLIKELKKEKNPQKAKVLASFFKTKKGQYGAGDSFLGISVPKTREITKKYYSLSLSEIEKLIQNKYHEIRLASIFLLIHKYKKGNLKTKKQIFNFYLKNTKYINNWDLVDLSASQIVGDYLIDKNREILLKLSQSKNLWGKRISIVSTYAFIYQGKSDYTFKIVKILLNDQQDLIHKACGWMLREVGKRVSEIELEAFLELYGPQMPRTMLRYAIEHFSQKKRQLWLQKTKK
jgi:3-methyladenine DNA glycosylase AlkD